MHCVSNLEKKGKKGKEGKGKKEKAFAVYIPKYCE